jgi:hypothetical protein
MLLKSLYDMRFRSEELHNEAKRQWKSPAFYTIAEDGTKTQVAIELDFGASKHCMTNEIFVKVTEIDEK